VARRMERKKGNRKGVGKQFRGRVKQ